MKKKCIWKKITACAAAVCLAAGSMASLTGCRGTLAVAMEEREKNKVTVVEDVSDLDLESLYHPSNGYQYREAQWLISQNQLEQALNADLGEGQPYSTDGSRIYVETTGVAASLNGVAPTGASVVLNADGLFSQVMIQFELNENLNGQALTELFNSVLDTLEENYGEALKDVSEEISYEEGTATRNGTGRTLWWEAELENGYLTTMQLVTITLTGSDVINSMLLGFNCYDPAVAESIEAEQASAEAE